MILCADREIQVRVVEAPQAVISPWRGFCEFNKLVVDCQSKIVLIGCMKSNEQVRDAGHAGFRLAESCHGVGNVRGCRIQQRSGMGNGTSWGWCLSF